MEDEMEDISEGLDDVELEGLDDKKEPEETEEIEEESEEKLSEKEEPSLDEKCKILEGKLTERETHIKNLNVALHQARQTKKADKPDEDTPLTREQLMAVFKEHQDNPETLFNVVEYMAKQYGKKAESSAIDATKIAQKKSDIDNRLLQAYPDLAKDDSDLRTGVNLVKTEMGIDDHPYGDLFALGAMTMNNLDVLLKQAREEGKQEALKGKVEDKRKEAVKKNALTPKGKTDSKTMVTGLTKDQESTAKQMGLKGNQLKIYARLITKKPVNVEA
uniref:Uncharacterized protein n=1 Tax=viral metagenome TaxID=1070528 RepID=A0A6M3J099_9ZZZZ